MGDPNAPDTDVVVNYTVMFSGVAEPSQAEYQRLQEALKNGYRVTDCISTPAAPGGGSSGTGFVSVTVILTKGDRAARFPYVKAPGR